MRFTKLLCILLSTALFSGCASQKNLRHSISNLQSGPKSPPTKTITNFSKGLTCMDKMLVEYKMPETTFLIENLTDNTGKVSGGTRDMLITALAAMSKRSNAIRIIAYGYDSSNAIAFIERTGARQLYSNPPRYGIRGSISQYDTRVASNRMSAAVNSKKWGFGGDKRVSGDVLGIDLSVIRTADLSVVPAATSSNQVIVLDTDGSGDGDAVIKKTGVYFNFSLDRSEGTTQAARNLFDLAAIELIGRLLKVPYWHCLGISEHSESVQQEVSEWMDMLDRDQKLVQFVRRVLYIKGFYNVSGIDKTRAFQQAVTAYQQNVGLTQNGVIDLEFMIALFAQSKADAADQSFNRSHQNQTEALKATTHHHTDAGSPTLSDDSNEVVSALNRHDRPVEVSIRRIDPSYINNEQHFAISLNQEGYLYCYFQDDQGDIKRFFPNRFQSNSYLKSGEILEIPGAMPFAIEFDPAFDETITCFATAEDIFDKLPLTIRSADFEALAVYDMASVREAFIQTALTPIGEAEIKNIASSYQ